MVKSFPDKMSIYVVHRFPNSGAKGQIQPATTIRSVRGDPGRSTQGKTVQRPEYSFGRERAIHSAANGPFEALSRLTAGQKTRYSRYGAWRAYVHPQADLDGRLVMRRLAVTAHDSKVVPQRIRLDADDRDFLEGGASYP